MKRLPGKGNSMSGILVYCEVQGGKIEDSYAQLVTAAQQIAKVSQDKIMALVCERNAAQYYEDMKVDGIAEIYGVETGELSAYATDSISEVVCQVIRYLMPGCILLPASPVPKSIFSRAAVRLGVGMTADCTGLVCSMEHDRLVIRQQKPSFGAHVLVSCCSLTDPQIMSITNGSFEAVGRSSRADQIKVQEMTGLHFPKTQITLVEEMETEHAQRITDADIVVCAGRGCLEGSGLELVKKFAEKIGAAVGGTRPLADNGYLPFENQIGQTGCVIRPRICITFGISGAVQFTEGIKGNPLWIAVNNDKDAAVFQVADYAVQEDLFHVLEQLILIKNGET